MGNLIDDVTNCIRDVYVLLAETTLWLVVFEKTT